MSSNENDDTRDSDEPQAQGDEPHETAPLRIAHVRSVQFILSTSGELTIELTWPARPDHESFPVNYYLHVLETTSHEWQKHTSDQPIITRHKFSPTEARSLPVLGREGTSREFVGTLLVWIAHRSQSVEGAQLKHLKELIIPSGSPRGMDNIAGKDLAQKINPSLFPPQSSHPEKFFYLDQQFPRRTKGALRAHKLDPYLVANIARGRYKWGDAEVVPARDDTAKWESLLKWAQLPTDAQSVTVYRPNVSIPESTIEPVVSQPTPGPVSIQTQRKLSVPELDHYIQKLRARDTIEFGDYKLRWCRFADAHPGAFRPDQIIQTDELKFGPILEAAWKEYWENHHERPGDPLYESRRAFSKQWNEFAKDVIREPSLAPEYFERAPSDIALLAVVDPFERRIAIERPGAGGKPALITLLGFFKEWLRQNPHLVAEHIKNCGPVSLDGNTWTEVWSWRR